LNESEIEQINNSHDQIDESLNIDEIKNELRILVEIELDKFRIRNFKLMSLKPKLLAILVDEEEI